ncbi:MAG TPA: aspartate-semialdehyde dehydrogenase [Sandaracinaceae bacterium LLY-WYZ-13_1]|nr:aspartate-semialdehyde dehydrogenase [Sandaracinaceae bacterium LLY-WYZ-13_1]
MTKQLNVAVLGATGAVGQEMLRVLEQRDFPVAKLIPLASPRSAGRKLRFRDDEVTVAAVTEEAFEGVDVALFSAGGGTSKEWAPKAAAKGAVVIDNSSAWRMDPECPLVVPEVNLDAGKDRPKGIIANPNCSTIQMVVALKPLHDVSRITRVVVSTYQAISGSGAKAVEAFLAQERALVNGEEVDTSDLNGQLAQNLLMHWKRETASGYQEEELKMVNETKKILGDPDIKVSPTAVRVPVVSGHAESLALEFETAVTPEQAREALEKAPGVEVVDDWEEGIYPQPIQCVGRDPVLVGRIREDVGNPGGLQLWCVGDNLRKGAALNAVQIAEGLFVD